MFFFVFSRKPSRNQQDSKSKYQEIIGMIDIYNIYIYIYIEREREREREIERKREREREREREMQIFLSYIFGSLAAFFLGEVRYCGSGLCDFPANKTCKQKFGM